MAHLDQIGKEEKMVMKIGVLHPGAMGISVAACAQNSGCDVYWASDGRSGESADRAAQHNLLDAETLQSLCATCSVIISVCPPHAAEEIADQVLSHGFQGVFVDVNAISPEKTRKIATRVQAAGADFVDGGIIGPPAWNAGTTWLYLSGPRATEIAKYFAAGPFTTLVIGDEIDRASALKMCFAAYTKGTTALLCAILATSENLGVKEDLIKQWSMNGSGFADSATQDVRTVTAKAWRFIGEMHEISSTFEAAGLPGGFHKAAADIYGRIAGFKGADSTPELDDVLSALLVSDQEDPRAKKSA